MSNPFRAKIWKLITVVTLTALLLVISGSASPAAASNDRSSEVESGPVDLGRACRAFKTKKRHYEPREIQVAANGLVFDTIISGPKNGRPVLLLHGFPENNTQWTSQIEYLSDAGYFVVAPNLRGYSPGAQPEAVEAYEIDRMASDVIAIADTLGLDNVDLVGHDYGAVTAWHTAALFPENIRSIVVLSSPHPDALSAAANDPSTDQLARLNSFLPFFTQPGSEQILLANNGFVLRSILAPTGLNDPELQSLIDFFGTGSTMATALNFFRAGGLDPAAPALGPVDVPVMYLWGENDPQLGPDAALLTENYVNGPYRFEILDGVNHWITYQAPDRVNVLLLDFLGPACR